MRVFKCVITKVVDGDTVDATCDLGFHISINVRFRLSLIDAPELKEGEPAIAAKLFLLKYAGVPLIVCSNKGDKYGRYLGEFWVEHEFSTGAPSINKSMIELGLAKPYGGK